MLTCFQTFHLNVFKGQNQNNDSTSWGVQWIWIDLR